MENFLKETNPTLYEQYKEEQKQHNYNKMKEWRQNNKEQFKHIQKKYKQKSFICDCGKSVTNNAKAYHLKSTLHSKLLKLNQTKI